MQLDENDLAGKLRGSLAISEEEKAEIQGRRGDRLK